MSLALFYPLAALTVAAGLAVVLTRNPVRSALALVGALFLLAVFYAALSAHLVAALQIIVYAGAVMVLFLFVITLLNLQIEPEDGRRGALTAAALAAGGVSAAVLASIVWNALAGTPAAVLPEGYGTTVALARRLFGRDIVAFELTSILLLVAVVGAVVLAQRDDAVAAEPEAGEENG